MLVPFLLFMFSREEGAIGQVSPGTRGPLHPTLSYEAPGEPTLCVLHINTVRALIYETAAGTEGNIYQRQCWVRRLRFSAASKVDEVDEFVTTLLPSSDSIMMEIRS